MTTRTELISFLIKKFSYKNYLEIGVQGGVNFMAIEDVEKVGVDPDPGSAATVHATSDHFFRENKKKYDLIFIDGLHLKEQVMKDILNSLNCLNEGGLILVHDCNPEAWKYQRRHMYFTSRWNGDVWKAIAQLRMNRDDLEIKVIDMDQGIGVIKPGSQILFKPKKRWLNWHFLKKNRKELLNLVSTSDFLASLK